MASSSLLSGAIAEYDGDRLDEDTDSDDAFDEDMEALRRACILTGTNPSAIPASAAPDPDSSSEDDLEIVRRIQQRLSNRPVAANPPKLSDSDDSDDFETLRAIERRFSQYEAGALKKNRESHSPKDELVCTTSLSKEQSTSNILFGNRNNGEALGEEFPDSDDPHANSQHLQYFCDRSPASQPSGIVEAQQPEDGTFGLSVVPLKNSSFPESAEMFIAAIKKNRLCQKFIRNKLIQVEARIEENKDLKRRLKHLIDFQVACKRRAGKVLSQPKDPRMELISLPKSRANASRKVMKAGEKVNPMYLGPDENSHVPVYKVVLEKSPISLHSGPWSKVEKENLAKGIKQQFQEMLLQKSIESYSEGSFDSNVDSIIASINDLEITPENIRSFLPHVDWERLASTYVMGRSGAECKSRWLNADDPMINHNPWTSVEDKKLLFIAQQRGIYNWIEIACLLGTNRTPFQCLVRYQRSLNPLILKRDWTEEEDARLRAVVEALGEKDWQRVAATLGGRTGPQCSNRWRKSLHPSRKRVGRWTEDEDKRLKMAVMLFGQKTWKKIAQFVPGRTQVQCRERWVNSLDPALNLEPWTKEEDSKLKAAFAEHGHCWSKIAALVPPRTDNQCWRRWKVLFPEEVALLRASRKIKRVAFISNFVDREEQRPALGPSDFVINPHSEARNEDINGKQKKKSCDDTQMGSTREAKPRLRTHHKKTLRMTTGDDVESSHGHSSVSDVRVEKRPRRTKAKTQKSESLTVTGRDDVDTSLGDDAVPKKRGRKRPPNARAEACLVKFFCMPDGVAGTICGDGFAPKKRKTKSPSDELLGNADRCNQPAEGQGDEVHPEPLNLEAAEVVGASLNGNRWSTADDCAQESRCQRQRAKCKTCPKDSRITQNHAVKPPNWRGVKKKAPKFVSERDLGSQSAKDHENIQSLEHLISDTMDGSATILHGMSRTEDGSQQVMRRTLRTTDNGYAGDALVFGDAITSDQHGGTCALDDNTFQNKHNEKKAHRMLWGDSRIHPVEEHEAVAHLDQSVVQSFDSNGCFLKQQKDPLQMPEAMLEISECCHGVADARNWLHAKETISSQGCELQENNTAGEVQTVPTVDWVQQWDKKRFAQDKLVDFYDPLDGQDVIKPEKHGDENHNPSSKSQCQNGRSNGETVISDCFPCGTREITYWSSLDLTGPSRQVGTVPNEVVDGSWQPLGEVQADSSLSNSGDSVTAEVRGQTIPKPCNGTQDGGLRRSQRASKKVINYREMIEGEPSQF